MIKSFLNHIKKLDWIMIVCLLLLVGIGLSSIYSSSVGEQNFLNFKKQIIFLIIGFSLMILVSLFDWRNLRDDPYLILFFYFLCIVGLIGLFFVSKTRGIKGWYKIGYFSISPTEFTKLALIILLAKYFSMRHIELYRIKHIIFSGIYVLIPSFLIFLQPDMGSVLILLSLWITVLLVSGIKLRHFLILGLCFVLIFALGWSFLLRDYQKARILSFVAPHLEPLGMGWNQAQAKIAIGSGGIFGKGIKKGTQVQYGFLPEPQTDFIFSALAEETGLVGIGFMFILFIILFWRIIRIATEAKSNFSRLFASGFGLLIASEIFINVGMNLGILPIIGIALPMVSYGGSGLILNFIGFGVLQSIKIYQ